MKFFFPLSWLVTHKGSLQFVLFTKRCHTTLDSPRQLQRLHVQFKLKLYIHLNSQLLSKYHCDLQTAQLTAIGKAYQASLRVAGPSPVWLCQHQTDHCKVQRKSSRLGLFWGLAGKNMPWEEHAGHWKCGVFWVLMLFTLRCDETECYRKPLAFLGWDLNSKDCSGLLG